MPFSFCKFPGVLFPRFLGIIGSFLGTVASFLGNFASCLKMLARFLGIVVSFLEILRVSLRFQRFLQVSLGFVQISLVCRFPSDVYQFSWSCLEKSKRDKTSENKKKQEFHHSPSSWMVKFLILFSEVLYPTTKMAKTSAKKTPNQSPVALFL